MAMLEESLVSMRLGFNERFLALRQLKYHINAMIKAANGEFGTAIQVTAAIEQLIAVLTTLVSSVS
jgi:hypothetical protein